MFITRAKSRWELIVDAPSGTSGIQQTPDNWVFTLVRIPTSQAIEVRVNKTVFPKDFFEVANSYRSKLAAGETPTEEETKTYKAVMKKFKEALKTLSDEELFITRVFTYEAKPFDVEKFIGYYAEPALNEYRRLKGVEAEVESSSSTTCYPLSLP